MGTYSLSSFNKGKSTKDGKKTDSTSSQKTELGKRKITVPKKKGSGTRSITIDQWQTEQLKKYLPKTSTRHPAVVARYQRLYDQALESKNPELIELRRQGLQRIKSGRPPKKGEPEVFTGRSVEDVRSRLEKKLEKLKKKRGYRAGNKEVMALRNSLKGLDKRYKSAVESGFDAASEADIYEKSPWEELWGYSDAAHQKHLIEEPSVTKPRPKPKTVRRKKVEKASPQSGTIVGSYPAVKKPVVVPPRTVEEKEGPAARYIREKREAKDKAKARKAGEEAHFKRLREQRDAKKTARVSAPALDTPISKDASRSGLEQFWKDIKDLPSNLAEDFLPKQIRGLKEEDYIQDLEDMGPGKRKYKWGDLEFTLDTTREEMMKGRPKESYKKGGRIKKSVKKTKARKTPAKVKSRKRAALRGHRAELRGG